MKKNNLLLYLYKVGSFKIHCICNSLNTCIIRWFYRFFEISLTSDIIERQTNPSLMEPDLPHDIVKELHDGDPAVGVHLKEFSEHRGCKELPEKAVKWLNVYIHVCKSPQRSWETQLQLTY